MISDVPDCVRDKLDDAAINEYLCDNGFYARMEELRFENLQATKENESLRKTTAILSRKLDTAVNESILARRRAANLEDTSRHEISFRDDKIAALSSRIAQLVQINSKLESDRDRIRQRLLCDGGEVVQGPLNPPRIFIESRDDVCTIATSGVSIPKPEPHGNSMVKSDSGLLSPGSIMKGLSVSVVEPSCTFAESFGA